MAITVTVDMRGGPKGAFTVEHVYRRDLMQRMNSFHLTRLAHMSRTASANLRKSIERPQESGVRAVHPAMVSKGRMTGNFLFGESGGAFKGTRIPGPEAERTGISGFGYPDIERADQRTGGIWRVLEWGLGRKRTPHPLASKGPHLLPRKFVFDPVRGSRILQGPADRPGKGIAGKLFLTNAWDDVTQALEKDYKKMGLETIFKVLRS